MFKIIKSSLNGINKLPEFNNWINMGFEGFKGFIVYIVYLIPVILLVLIWMIIFGVQDKSNILAGFDSIYFLLTPLISIIWPGIMSTIINLINFLMMIIGAVIVSYLGILYIILVVPINFSSSSKYGIL